jgi:hypothetical protein
MIRELFNSKSNTDSDDHIFCQSNKNVFNHIRDLGILSAAFTAALTAPSFGLGAVFLAETASGAMVAGGLSCVASAAITPGVYAYSQEVIRRMKDHHPF